MVMMRCTRCHRPLKAENAKTLYGFPYGSECYNRRIQIDSARLVKWRVDGVQTKRTSCSVENPSSNL